MLGFSLREIILCQSGQRRLGVGSPRLCKGYVCWRRRCLYKVRSIHSTACSPAHCNIGNTGIDCWDDVRRRCREGFAAGSSNFCDPCPPAVNNCLAQSSASRATALASCSGASVSMCQSSWNSIYDTVNTHCSNCLATCRASPQLQAVHIIVP